jgi:hypothetical protein
LVRVEASSTVRLNGCFKLRDDRIVARGINP